MSRAGTTTQEMPGSPVARGRLAHDGAVTRSARTRPSASRPRSTSSGRVRPGGPAALVGVVLVGGLLAGCSGADAPQDGGAPSAGASMAAQPSSSSPSSTAGPSASAAPTTTVVTSMTTFTAPSGNISCYLAPVQGADPYARCDLAQTSWKEPEPDGGCDGTWGGGESGRGSVGVGGGPAAYLCVGDELVAGSGQVLPYGSSIVLEPITCTSTTDGMTCENGKTGHGFTAARAKAVLR